MMAKSMAKSHASRSASARGGKPVLSQPPLFIGQELEKKIPLFPLLAEIDTVFPEAFTQTHMIVDSLQMISFGLLPYHRWGNAAFGVLRALFFTHLPLFDPMILSAGFVATLAVMIVHLILLLACVAGTIAYLFRDSEIGRHQGRTGQLVKLILYPTASILLVPALQNYVAIATCGWLPTGGPADDSMPQSLYLFWFSANQQCYQGITSLSLAVSIIGVTTTCFLAYVMNTMLFDINPMSRHRLARATSILDGPYLGLRLISVALMHFSLVTDGMVYFCVWMAISSFVLAVCYMYSLPYYRRHANQLRIASLLTCSFYSVLSATTYASPVWTNFLSNNNTDIAIMFSMLPFAWYLFYYVLAELRTSRIFLSAMDLLHEGTIPEPVTHFPKNLPVSEEIFESNREMISDLLDGQTAASVDAGNNNNNNDDDDDDEASKEYHFTVPYVNYVTFAVDVELASRFLLFFKKFTNKELTKYQLTYSAKLFCKGCAKFRQSSVVRLHTACFLLYHGLKPRLALAQLQILRGLESSLSERYQAWKMNTKICNALRIGESTRIESFTRARRRQRDALYHTSEFWQLLLSDDVDKNALSNSARSLLADKEDVLQVYRTLLSTNAPSMDALACYTNFCRDVINSEEAAAQCLQCLREIREQKTSNTMRGAKVRVDADTMTQIPLDFDEDENDEQTKDQNVEGVTNSLIITSVVSILLVVGFIIGYATTSPADAITYISRAGDLRALGARCAVAGSDIIYSDLNGINTTEKERELLSLQQDFRVLHNSLTYGYKFPSEEHHVLSRAPQSLRVAHNLTINFWTLGTVVSVALRDVVAQKSNSTYQKWVTTTLADDVVFAVNTTLKISADEFAKFQSNRLLLSCLLLGAALVSIVAANYVVFSNSRKIDGIRMDIFALFTLIPRRSLKKLARESRKKLLELEAFFTLSSKDKVTKLIGAPTTAGAGEEHQLKLGGGGGGGDIAADAEDAKHANSDKEPASPTSPDGLIESEFEESSRRGSEVGSQRSQESIIQANSGANDTDSIVASRAERRRARRQRHEASEAAADEQTAQPDKVLQMRIGVDAAYSPSNLAAFAGIVVFGLVAVALSSLSVTMLDVEAGVATDLTEFIDTVNGVAYAHRKSFVAARSFVQTGARRYLEEYVSFSAGNTHLDDLNRFVRRQLDDGLSRRFFDIKDAITAVNELELMGVRLALSSFGSDVSTVFSSLPTASIAVTSATWPVEDLQSYPDVSRRLLGQFNNRLGFVNGSVSDLNASRAIQLDHAREIMSWETLLGLEEFVMGELRSLSIVDQLTAKLTKARDESVADITVAIIASFFMMLLLLYLFFSVRKFSTFLKSPCATVSLAVLTLVGIATFGLALATIGTMTQEDHINTLTTKIADDTLRRYAWETAIRNELDFSANYLVSGGYLLWLLKYRSIVQQDFSAFVVNPILDLDEMLRGIPSSSSSLTGGQRDQLYSQVNDLIQTVNQVKNLDAIAIALEYTATSFLPKNKVATSVFNTSSLSIITWNFAQEENYRLTQATYSGLDDPTFFYSSRGADVVKPVANITAIAAAAIFSHRMDDLLSRIDANLQQLFATIIGVTREALTSHAQTFEIVNIALVACAGFTALGALILGSIVLVSSALTASAKLSSSSGASSSRHSSSSGGGKAGGSGGHQGTSASPSSSSSSSNGGATVSGSLAYISQTIVGLIIAAVLALAIAQVVTTDGVPDVLDAATNRMWIIANTRYISDRMAREPSFVATGQQLLRQEYQRLVASTKTLYFHDSAKYFSVDIDGTQDNWLFARAVSYANQLYQFTSGSGIFVSSSTGNVVSDSGNNKYVCNPILGQDYLNKISRGVGLIYGEAWPSILYTLAYASPSEIPTLVDELTSLYSPLILGLSNSNDLYRTYYTSQDTMWYTAILAIAIAAVVLILFQHSIILTNFVANLSREESTARLMLRIIPQDIRESNKQIQSFLESGKVKTQTDDLSEAIMNMSSQPVIAIDQKGTILRFSNAAEKVFGYTASEVMGSNIKMLMPHEYAMNHDHYLATYRRTHVKKVVDLVRRVRAVRKSGDQFPIELRVKELMFGDESVFIGFLKDVSGELDLLLQDELNKYILDMSQDSILAIDSYGTILSVNQAVQTVFGYQRDEVVRENIKLLMPAEIALHHDGYLQRYRETGVKTIVDSSRQLQAQRKNGEIFHAQITVREIKGSQAGESSTFIGFVVDVTKEHQAAIQNEINDIISDLSPVPIIAINDKGVFVKFSRAAASLFQYSKEELVNRGQNIQVLVPPKFGDHSQYMKNYFRTGVPKVVGFTRNILAMKKDKTIFPAMLTLREIKKQGMLPVFLGYMVDITNSLQMEEAGKLSQAVMEYSMVPIFVTTMKGIILQSNDAAVAAFGYSQAEMLNQNVNLLMPKQTAEIHDNIIQNYLRTKEKHVLGITRNVPARRRNGEIFPTELALREVPPTEYGDGCFFAYVRDVSTQRATLQQFMINDAITQLSIIPIIAISIAGLVECFSPAAEECFGYSASEVIGENIKMLMPPEIAENHDDYLERYKRTRVKTIVDSTRVLQAKRRDGSFFSLEVSVREIKKEGTQSSFVGYCRETTRDAALEEESKIGSIIRDLSAIPIVLIDPLGTVSYANAAFCTEFLFARPSDIVGKNIKLIIPEEIAKGHDEILARYVARGPDAAEASPIVGKIRRLVGIRSDGSQVQLEAKIAEIRSSRSGHLQFVGFLRNLATQLLLEQANHTIDTITNLSLVPIVSIDHRGIVIKFSNAASQSFGYDASEVLGNNVKMLMPEEIAEKHDGLLRTYFRTHVKNVIGTVARQEGRRKDGSRFPVELSIKEIVKSGQNSLFIGYLRDASQDTMLEKSMQLSNLVTHLSPVPIVVINRRGLIQTFNQAACLTFEFAADEAIGQNVTMLMTELDAKYHDKHLKTYAATRIKSSVDAVKTRNAIKKSGTVFSVEVAVKEVIPANGDMNDVCYLGFLRDMTEYLTLQKAGIVNDTIANMSAIPLIAIMSNGNIIKFSTSAEECFGYTSAEVYGKNVSMLMPDETAAKHDGYLANFRKKNIDSEGEFTAMVYAKRRSGVRFPIQISVREVRKAGQQSMFVGYCRDISSTFEVLRQKLLCEAAVNLSSTPIITMKTDGTILTFNEAAEDCFGYSQNEVLHQNIKILMPKAVADQHDGYLSTYARTGVKTVVDQTRSVTAKRKNGKKFAASISVREVQVSATEKIFCGYVRDNSAQAGLEHASLVNDAIISLSSCAVVTISTKGIIAMFSKGAEAIFGYTAAEVVGQNVSMLMAEPHRSVHDKYLSTYAATKVSKVLGRITRDLVAVKKDGTEFFVELQVSEIQIAGHEGGFVASIRDIDASVKMQADLAISKAQEEMSLRSIVIINEAGIIQRANLATSGLFGYGIGEMVGKNVKMLMPDEMASKHDRILASYKATGVKKVIGTSRNVMGKTKSGQLIEIQINVNEIIKEDGTKAFVAYLADSSMNKELVISAGIASSLLRLIPTPIVMIDHVGSILEFNPAAQHVFEFTPEQVLGKNVKILMPEETQKQHDKYLKTYFATGEKKVIDKTRQVEGETKSGTRIPLQISVREIRKITGEIVFAGYLKPTGPIGSASSSAH